MKGQQPKIIWVALPTYNEAGNITGILTAISKAFAKRPDIKANVLVIDDKSPDGTADLVRKFKQTNVRVELLEGNKAGLGNAYARGFDHILAKNEDVLAIMEMDADFSHNPKMLPIMIDTLIEQEADLVIGSRYVDGGFIPGDWPLKRIINTRVARWVARTIGGITTSVADPTAGLRAYRSSTLRAINYDLPGSTGYVFQVSLTDAVDKQGMKIVEIPINFSDRKVGSSKISVHDITGFVTFCAHLNPDKLIRRFTVPVMASLSSAVLSFVIIVSLITSLNVSSSVTVFLSLAVALAVSDAIVSVTKWWNQGEQPSRNFVHVTKAWRATTMLIASTFALALGFSWHSLVVITLAYLLTYVAASQKVNLFNKLQS